MTKEQTLDCRTASNRLSDYIDGALPAVGAEAVSRHLSACAACRRLEGDLRSIRDGLVHLPPVPPPPGLYQRVMRDVRYRPVAPRHARGRNLWLAVAATLLVACGAGLLSLMWKPPGRSPVDTTYEQAMLDMRQAEALYRGAARTLEALARRNIARLPPENRLPFEEGLAMIDRAIRQLEGENWRLRPGSPAAMEYLLTAYQKKVDFLRSFLEETAFPDPLLEKNIS